MALIDITNLHMSNGLHFIMIKGEINVGDDVAFMEKTFGIRKAIVFFDSNGGDLDAGLSIGEQIRAKDFATCVPPHTTCASAAALAWLGGNRRYMEPQSAIGFHASYLEGKTIPDAQANARIGFYLKTLNLPLDTVKFVTEANPTDLKWLSMPEALCLGIEVISVNGVIVPIPEEIAPDTSNEAYLVAMQAGEEFDKAVKTHGLLGVNVLIEKKYKIFQRNQTQESMIRAAIIDLLANELDYRFAEDMKNFDIRNEFNNDESLDKRLEKLIPSEITDIEGRNRRKNDWRLLSYSSLK